MNIFIVEDESLYAEQLRMMVERSGHQVCGMAEDAEDALRVFEQCMADLALIDINLSGSMNGLELGRWLKRFKDIPIIYITSHYDNEEYFERAKQLTAYAFMKKPIDVTHLARTIELAFQQRADLAGRPEGDFTDAAFSAGISGTGRAADQQAEDDSQILMVRIKAKYIKINQRDITHIIAEDKYCAIHLRDGSVYLERISLKDLSMKLSPRLFAQTHRSFIVNLQEVQETDTSAFTIKVNNHQIPLGDTYKDYFLRKFGV